MKILIDNGHGSNTPGKASPDGRLREYAYTREVAKGIVTGLKRKGYDAELLTPETLDVKLGERVRRANAETRKAGGTTKCIVVSIHTDASPPNDNQWHEAGGRWSARVSLNASKRSKLLAHHLAEAARAKGLKVGQPLPNQDYWPQNLAICRDTNCPAVLTESLFHNNRKDVDYLLSPTGKQAIIQLHIDGIINYITKEATT